MGTADEHAAMRMIKIFLSIWSTDILLIPFEDSIGCCKSPHQSHTPVGRPRRRTLDNDLAEQFAGRTDLGENIAEKKEQFDCQRRAKQLRRKTF